MLQERAGFRLQQNDSLPLEKTDLIAALAASKARPLSAKEKKRLAPLIKWGAKEILKKAPETCMPPDPHAPNCLVPHLDEVCRIIGAPAQCVAPGTGDCTDLNIDRYFSIALMLTNFLPGSGQIARLGWKGLKKLLKKPMKQLVLDAATEVAEGLYKKYKKDISKFIKSNLKELVKEEVMDQASLLAAEAGIHEIDDSKDSDADEAKQILEDMAKAFDPTGILEVIDAFNTDDVPKCLDLMPAEAPTVTDWEDPPYQEPNFKYFLGSTGLSCPEGVFYEVTDRNECVDAASSLKMPFKSRYEGSYFRNYDDVCYFGTRDKPSDMFFDSHAGAGARKMCKTEASLKTYGWDDPIFGFNPKNTPSCSSGDGGVRRKIYSKTVCEDAVHSMPWVAATTYTEHWSNSGSCYYGVCDYKAGGDYGICFDSAAGSRAYHVCSFGANRP